MDFKKSLLTTSNTTPITTLTNISNNETDKFCFLDETKKNHDL